jgi:hypothetical protein
MTFFEVEEFTICNHISQFPHNTYRLYWMENGKRMEVSLDLHSLLLQVSGRSRHVQNVKRIFKLLDDPDLDKILADSEVSYLITRLPPHAEVPGRTFSTQKEYDDFRNECFLAAYNQVYNTYLTYQEVINS